jgi:asparagine N-glycosylation enzyme membrane subunit Stt3
VNESRTERKRLLSLVTGVFVISLTLRVTGDHRIPPFDDLYHLKRIEFSAAHFLDVLEFDPDRGEQGAFCPWPPLYDLLSSVLGPRVSVWIPPVFFAIFAAAVTLAMFRFGTLAAATAGFTLALSPYLIGASAVGHIDHHYVEPLLVLLIVATAVRRNGLLLALAITLALFVQTAMIVAAALAFLVMFDHPREGAKAFAIPALAIVLYRFTLPPSYPVSAWFLGLPHAVLLCGAAMACAARSWMSRWMAFLVGAAVALAFPPSATALLSGLHFFGRDPWLSSIVEFQPMFRNVSQTGTDIANMTGGAVLAVLQWRRQRTFAIFSIAYLILAISSRRFLVPAIALFAIGGAFAAAYAHRRDFAIAAMIVTLLPPIAYDLYAMRIPEPSNDEFRAIGERMRALPRGRVLAPWSFGHAIDVIGRKPVIIDNFGSMPDERVFTQAIEAMLATRESSLLDYCHARGVRYLVLPHPAYIPATAATLGIDRDVYSRTRLARRTVWSRLYGGDTIAGFALVSRAAVSIWKIE